MEEKIVHKLVLTGGPCGGKTTVQKWLFKFFNNLGWKVLLVPETATVLLGGGIKFSDLNEEQVYTFQENLLKTMIQMENTFFEVARGMNENCLVICDRGTMDASAFMQKDEWEQMLTANGWNNTELGKHRYDQVIHLVTAADGAEKFYTTEDHTCRSETIEMAREVDNKNSLAWKNHPCFDVVDNSQNFDIKMCRVIQCVCEQLGIYTGDTLEQFIRITKCLVKDQIHET